MPCTHYKDALIEATGSGAEPQGELRVHLAGCPDCLATFEQEQSLFASIDAGLRVAANVEVPASFLPRVRARLDEQPVPRRVGVTNWLVFASAAVAVVAFFGARAVWRPSVVNHPAESAENTVVVPPVSAPPKNHDPVLVPAAGTNSDSQSQDVVAKLVRKHGVQASGKTTPEVLVPHDQEILLAEYAELWSLHKHAVLVARDFDATSLSPLQLAPIQIDELDVKPLADEKWQ